MANRSGFLMFAGAVLMATSLGILSWRTFILDQRQQANMDAVAELQRRFEGRTDYPDATGQEEIKRAEALLMELLDPEQGPWAESMRLQRETNRLLHEDNALLLKSAACERR